MNPAATLHVGCEILDPVLTVHGFVRRPIESGPGSGGPFARTEYLRTDRRLELHFRYSLGLVTYHLGGSAISHDAYMRAVLGTRGANQYPGFSQDPLDGFRHLRHDLQQFCGEFLSGSEEAMAAVVATAVNQAQVRGFKALSRS